MRAEHAIAVLRSILGAVQPEDLGYRYLRVRLFSQISHDPIDGFGAESLRRCR